MKRTSKSACQGVCVMMISVRSPFIHSSATRASAVKLILKKEEKENETQGRFRLQE